MFIFISTIESNLLDMNAQKKKAAVGLAALQDALDVAKVARLEIGARDHEVEAARVAPKNTTKPDKQEQFT